MCQIFAVSAKEKIELNGYLKEFYKNSVEHLNGWGLALMDGGNVTLEKEPVRAIDSVYLKNRLSTPVRSASAFAHIRYATIGNMKYLNCHPFTAKDKNGRQWVQNHNGTIFEYEPLEKYVRIQQGETDSERIFMYIIDSINRAEERKKLSASARFSLIDGIICEMSKGNKLNYMLYDGEILYIHTNYGGSLHVKHRAEGAVFSTVPLDRGDWQPLPLNTLLGYKDGELVFTGTDHGNTFIDNEENMKMLYRIFAEL